MTSYVFFYMLSFAFGYSLSEVIRRLDLALKEHFDEETDES
jgi:hypothetical protein